MSVEPKAIQRKSLLRGASVFSIMTFLSRILGLLRDMIIAHQFGAVAGFDAFLIAFKIPNFTRRLFAEGAFSQAFVPVLSEYQETKTQAITQDFINVMMGNLALVLIAVCVVIFFAAPWVVKCFAPGFATDGQRFVLAASMLKITSPYLIFICLTAFCGAVLNTYGNFAVPAFTPVLLNLCLIAGAVSLAPHLSTPVMALAIAVSVAGVIQLLFQIPYLWRYKVLPKPTINFKHPGAKKVLRLMLPALLGVSVVQLNIMIDTIFASFLPVGSVTWLYYSDRLMNFPLGVFGVGIATVILPHLSRQHINHNHQNYTASIDWAIRLILLISIPACIGLGVLAGPILATLLGYGKFSTHDVLMARSSLMAFSVGLPAFMLIKVLASSFYARQQIKTPVKVALLALVINLVLNIVLIKPLAHAGLALATSIAAMVNAALLLILLIKQGFYQFNKTWFRFSGQLIIANLVLVLWLIVMTRHTGHWMDWHGLKRFVSLFIIVIGGIVLYATSLALMGLRFRQLKGPGRV